MNIFYRPNYKNRKRFIDPLLGFSPTTVIAFMKLKSLQTREIFSDIPPPLLFADFLQGEEEVNPPRVRPFEVNPCK